MSLDVEKSAGRKRALTDREQQQRRMGVLINRAMQFASDPFFETLTPRKDAEMYQAAWDSATNAGNTGPEADCIKRNLADLYAIPFPERVQPVTVGGRPRLTLRNPRTVQAPALPSPAEQEAVLTELRRAGAAGADLLAEVGEA